MRVVPGPEICWFETVVGRPYLLRNLTGSNREVSGHVKIRLVKTGTVL